MSDEARNMYGCKPCPKCGSRFRYVKSNPYGSAGAHDPQPDHLIACDDCGDLDFVDVGTLIAAGLVEGCAP